MTTPPPILAALDLIVFQGKVEVLNIPAFHLAPGEVLALIGPNGSGKSTLLLTLNGLLTPRKGQIFFRGEELRSRADFLRYRRKTAMVFQAPLLFDTTVFNNVASGLKMRGISNPEIKDRVFHTLERFHIAHLAHRSARKLSGGEAQRTALARALAVEPEVIFLDEPFSDLDLPTRQAVMADLERVIQDNGIAAVLVTHDLSDVLGFSDRVMVLKKGRIIQEGTIQEVRDRPGDLFAARLVGIENLFPGRVIEKERGRLGLACAGSIIWAEGNWPIGAKVVCGIRPEEIHLFGDGEQVSGQEENLLSGQVVSFIPIGPWFKVTLDCGFPLLAYLPAHSCKGLHPGQTFFASFKASSVRLIAENESRPDE